MIGERLGPYEITARIGAGGMGEVYRARDPRLGREVAIKVLPSEVARDPDRLRRFELEARAASQLNHPNILVVHDFGVDADRSYLVTELLQGESLRELLARGPLPAERAIEIARQVCAGLAAAHREGIVHRDLKPENLFVTRDGICKILDFGLARIEKPESADPDWEEDLSTLLQTSAGTVLGTAGYMAPEQVRGERADARSDLFSLGVVLHELLAGVNPFRRESVVESLHAILKEEPPALAAANGAGAGDLDPLLRRCLEKEPEARFQSASDLALALENLSGARRAERRTTAAAGRRSRRLAAAVAALAVVAVAAALYLSRGGASGGAAPMRALAVLPFESRSPEADDEYFSDGMTDVLTTELARLPALKVIARNSAARFKGSRRPPVEIARELGVEGLISGSVLRAGERVRISAQLAEAGSDRVVWAESYDRAVSDVLSLQGEVARAIAGAIALELSPGEASRLSAARAVDPRALDEVLRARALWRQRTEAGVREALAHFRAAADLAPDFALAHTGIADVHIIMAAYNWMEPRRAAAIALEEIGRAIALDPQAGEPHASRGDLAYHVELDFERAARELDRAIELSPSYATAYAWRAEAALASGGIDAAIGLLERSLDLDPLAAFPRTLLAFARGLAGDAEASRREYERALETSPGYFLPQAELARLDLAAGSLDAAVARARRMVDEEPSAEHLALLGVALGMAGERAEARTLLERLRALGRERWVSPYDLASVEAVLGDRQAALADLAAALAARDFRMPLLRVRLDVEFRELASDPELVALVGGIGARATE